ncbi:hypothetical protein [Streptomyces sp. NPDC003717]|uniref:hypothetical protein n=1 Tax=Streptomyces sp. NPDC003717 TaxID=3154276 RepID=UPI00339E9CB1
MIPPAALAVVRAGVETARGNGLDAAEDVAEQVVGELLAAGWTIVLAESGSSTPAAA